MTNCSCCSSKTLCLTNHIAGTSKLRVVDVVVVVAAAAVDDDGFEVELVSP